MTHYKTTCIIQRLGVCVLIIGVPLFLRAAETTTVTATNEIVSLIKMLPDWGGAQVKFDEAQPTISKVKMALVKYQTDQIRYALQVYLDQAGLTSGSTVSRAWSPVTEDSPPAASPPSVSPIDAWGQSFLLNRLVFEVPPVVPEKETNYFAGWIDLKPSLLRPRPGMLWPFTLKDGEPVLSYNTSGYAGAPYYPVAEFDFFQSRFERRK